MQSQMSKGAPFKRCCRRHHCCLEKEWVTKKHENEKRERRERERERERVLIEKALAKKNHRESQSHF